MVSDRQISGAGTPEADWRRHPAWAALPSAPVRSLVPAAARLVVCAPHPDDEILPCGGLLAAAADLGHPILILAITDGEASHGPSSVWSERLREGRPRETADALRRLEIDAEVRRLRFPDGGLALREDALAETLRSLIRSGDVVLAPWRWDGHPDHEATARAAAKTGCTLLETPIWGWHWARPAEAIFPWASAVRFDLGEGLHRRKLAAIAAFTSQLEPAGGRPPVLAESTLRRFRRREEVFFR